MRRPCRALLTIIGVAALAVSVAHARTLTVAKDGTGQYSVIQAAVDAAAPGDTILIGPGRYTEMAPMTVPGWTENVCVSVTTDNLTLLGAGADVTFIGPEAAKSTPRPKGIVGYLVSDLTIIDLAVENIREGIYRSDGHLSVRNCSFRNCVCGIVAWTDAGLLVEGSQFVCNTGNGIVTWGPSSSVLVSECTFENDAGIGIANGTADAIVQDCHFHHGVVGVSIQGLSSGTIIDCTFQDVLNYAIDVYHAHAVLMNNTVSGGGGNLALDGQAVVSGSGNVFGGGSFATIYDVNSPDVNLHGNHILNAGGYSVKLAGFIYSPASYLDLADNYWGTSEPNQLAQWIWDKNDDPSIQAYVTYEPFSGGPVGTEEKSWGELKTLYGR